MGLIKKYFSNTRKPDGILGKMMVSGMNTAYRCPQPPAKTWEEGSVLRSIA